MPSPKDFAKKSTWDPRYIPKLLDRIQELYKKVYNSKTRYIRMQSSDKYKMIFMRMEEVKIKEEKKNNEYSRWLQNI